jgi:hypothetical protein
MFVIEKLLFFVLKNKQELCHINTNLKEGSRTDST